MAAGKAAGSEALAEISDHLGAEATQLFAERSTAEVSAAFDRELTAVPRVQGVLDWLHARGVSNCVASSGTYSKLRKTLGLTGLYGRFDGNIYSVLDVAHGKPAPDLFLYAASQMGVRPERCAVIEDSRYGVQAAVSAGMTAFGFAGGLADASVLAGAGAIVFSDMAELPRLLSSTSAGERVGPSVPADS